MPKAAVWERSGATLRIRLRVQPRSSRSRISGVHGQALKVTVTAPPVDGQANAAVIALLADVLEVAKSRLTIVAGKTGKDKVVEIVPAEDAVTARLEAVVARVDKQKVGD